MKYRIIKIEIKVVALARNVIFWFNPTPYIRLMPLCSLRSTPALPPVQPCLAPALLHVRSCLASALLHVRPARTINYIKLRFKNRWAAYGGLPNFAGI